MATQSGKPTYQKLGITEISQVYIINPPDLFLNSLPVRPVYHPDSLDLVLLFTSSKAELTQAFHALMSTLKENGMFWIAWPKKSSGLTTDLDENVIREIGLLNGMVDVKVIAIDEVWSGLKFVFRIKDRHNNTS